MVIEIIFGTSILLAQGATIYQLRSLLSGSAEHKTHLNRLLNFLTPEKKNCAVCGRLTKDGTTCIDSKTCKSIANKRAK
jgi:hypothetical protein